MADLGEGADSGEIMSRLQPIVEEAHRVLGRPIAIDDRHHRLLAYTEHPTEGIDPVRLASILRQPASPELLAWLGQHGVRTACGPVHVKANDDLGLQARVCVPIRCQTHLLGFFWLVDPDESVPDADLQVAEAAAEEAGVVLYREIMLRDLDRGREREFMRDILSRDDDVRAHAIAQLAELDLFAPDGPVVVIVVRLLGQPADLSPEVRRLSLDAALLRVRRWLAPKHALHLLRPDHALMLVSLSDSIIRSQGRTAFSGRLHDEIMRSVSADNSLRCVVAIGGHVDALLDATTSLEQALRAARVAESIPSFGDVVNWETLGIYRVLAELPADRLGPDDIRPGLQDLLDDPRQHMLVRTVERYLDNAGDAQATSSELFVHRTSLYHRLRRFERATGIDLNNGEDRLILHLGLKLARLQGRSWPDSTID